MGRAKNAYPSRPLSTTRSASLGTLSYLPGPITRMFPWSPQHHLSHRMSQSLSDEEKVGNYRGKVKVGR